MVQYYDRISPCRLRRNTVIYGEKNGRLRSYMERIQSFTAVYEVRNRRPGLFLFSGSKLDIHMTSTDRKFPYDEDVIVVAQASPNYKMQIKHFINIGILTIDGVKMSSSLKNYVTIQQALKKNTPREIPLLFLLNARWFNFDYSKENLAEARLYDKIMIDFCNDLKTSLSAAQLTDDSRNTLNERDRRFYEVIEITKENISVHLKDSIDIVHVMDE
ncbi:unnamed protein product [Rotaria sp. Silwood2]|nr:unnamed protein product [Rotaria sp. Silwood2]CAF3416459.1 unnamed protein product [Rotaria sp. Silwood2]CAF4491494.1 unnamed protein product [Rotaria sp. Silwood2]